MRRTLRIVTWNSARGTHAAKLPALLALKPDIAVIQETPQPTSQIAPGQLWTGTNLHQGLMVLTFNGWQVDGAAKVNRAVEFFLPVKVSRGAFSFNLLAAWVKKGSAHPVYTTMIQRGLAAHASLLRSGPCVLAGDFNTWCDEEVCEPFGLVSAYHAFNNEDFGYESRSTHYFRRQRNPNRCYHFDLCFVPSAWGKKIEKVSVGRFADWVRRRDGGSRSDHVPVTVDLKLPLPPAVSPSFSASRRIKLRPHAMDRSI